MVPHAVIDILRECNIACRACYNAPPYPPPKPFEVIQEEVETLLRMRRLSSISILGGEATLHPELCRIIRFIRQKGLHPELITNGLEIDETYCRKLKEAGLAVIYFHIERGQKRPDLPQNHTLDDINRLRTEKTLLASNAGLDVGLILTAFPGAMEDVQDVISFTLKTPEVNYLLVTLYRDHSGVKTLHGNIISGFKGTGTPPDETTKQSNVFFSEWMNREFGFSPFAFMGSNLDPDDPRWLSYLIGSVYQADESHYVEHIKPSLLEKAAMLLFRMAGRYPMYMEQNADRFRHQLRLNGLMGGRRQANKELVRQSKHHGARLTAKRLLFQNPAELTADGKLIHCKSCPDAVLKNGVLVPVCITDNVS